MKYKRHLKISYTMHYFVIKERNLEETLPPMLSVCLITSYSCFSLGIFSVHAFLEFVMECSFSLSEGPVFKLDNLIT
jgi:hypothetical protein